MTGKQGMIVEIGEEELLLPQLVNNALAANDRIKYYFTLLQTAVSHADHPFPDPPSLIREREAAGEDDARLDRVVSGTITPSRDQYVIPDASRILGKIQDSIADMARPLLARDDGDSRVIRDRLDRLTAGWPDLSDGSLPGEFLAALTSGDPKAGDSLHLLVMDMHAQLNRLQAELAEENIEGAYTYLLGDDDRDLVRAFMEGVNRTSSLRFDHPGLGTTATRTPRHLIIQNDIGVTDAHVLVVHVEGMRVTVTYTDIHMPRLQFFQGMIEGWEVRWEDTVSRRGTSDRVAGMYHLAVGVYESPDRERLQGFLRYFGSRLVFLIDWNRARKRLRNFLLNKDAIAVLRWAAREEVGHMAFLHLGGEAIVYEALEFAAKVPLRYGEPLHQILGREKTVEFLQWTLKASAQGLLAGRSRHLIQDEVKAELMRNFRSAHESLMEVCEEHASLIIEVATVCRDSLLQIQTGKDLSVVGAEAMRAKAWESKADDLVRDVRTLSHRIEEAEFYSTLISTADDVIDQLEEASYSLSLVTQNPRLGGIHQAMNILSNAVLDASQEYLRCLMASRQIQQGPDRGEMQAFLRAVDRIFLLEHECDDALRRATRTILAESADFREMMVFFMVARNLERASNALMKAAYLLRDRALEGVSR